MSNTIVWASRVEHLQIIFPMVINSMMWHLCLELHFKFILYIKINSIYFYKLYKWVYKGMSARGNSPIEALPYKKIKGKWAGLKGTCWDVLSFHSRNKAIKLKCFQYFTCISLLVKSDQELHYYLISGCTCIFGWHLHGLDGGSVLDE